MRIESLTAAKSPALSGIANPADGVVSSRTAKAGGDDFRQTLMDVLKEVNSTQQDARAKQNALMTGQQVDYHDLMIAMEKASVALQLTMAVRNKILEAYQEVSRMQV
ncbi:MAG: flagellar hook-basal body complex protein FliE [Fimbriimonas ginsengisoli]|uniref:Flagellar hook-basal body complex protein FliE n=1 Tax=Fimbriimonas ginsengisoli TaxID=1005039 RepID=A0A931PW55_FIMGI|nr:flagellar hook-basal body complex protein FliE [Fimbriimonas ginsengisoli]